MENKQMYLLAGMILNEYLPAEKNEKGSLFVSKYELVRHLKRNYNNGLTKKILQISGFKQFVRNYEGKTTRGYCVKANENGGFDIKTLPGYGIEDVIKKENVTILSQSDALKYISDNWYILREYMTEDIIQEHKRDPAFTNMTTFKINKAIRLAGFKPTLTLFEERRVLSKPEVPKNIKKKKIVDMAQVLHGELFEPYDTTPEDEI